MRTPDDPLVEAIAKLLYEELQARTAWHDVSPETRAEFRLSATTVLAYIHQTGRLLPDLKAKTFTEWGTYSDLTGLHIWRTEQQARQEAEQTGDHLMSRLRWWSDCTEWESTA